MAEYNIQMNRYVSASDSYDQLFPKTKTVDVVDQNGDNLDTLLGEKIGSDEKGAANGVASLGADGKVPNSQLPEIGYSKEETLTAATAALYGLTNTAVPDDVFAWLGKYAEYWWERRTYSYEISKSFISLDIKLIGTGSSTRTVLYADTVEINQATGQPNLVGAQTYVVSGTTTTDLAQFTAKISGKYIKSEQLATPILYVPSNATYGTATTNTVYSSSGFYLSSSASIKSEEVKSVPLSGEWELVFSTNRSAYPDSGIVDGYEYKYRGIPFDKLPTAPQIETGSYVGTGTYGASNPNSLTFSFKPKVLMIAEYPYVPTLDGTTNAQHGIIILMDMVSDEYKLIKNYGAELYCKYQENVLSYYTNQNYESVQLNISGKTYYYLAIG